MIWILIAAIPCLVCSLFAIAAFRVAGEQGEGA